MRDAVTLIIIFLFVGCAAPKETTDQKLEKFLNENRQIITQEYIDSLAKGGKYIIIGKAITP